MKIQKAVGPLLDRFLPTARLVDAVRPEDMTRNPIGVEAYRNDPMCYPNTKLVLHTVMSSIVRVSFAHCSNSSSHLHGLSKTIQGWELSKYFDLMKTKRAEITCPVLILHGSGDKVRVLDYARLSCTPF